MEKTTKGEVFKINYPLLVTGRDWRKRIPPKRGHKKMTGKIYMTRDDWMKYYNDKRKTFGNNVLDWPKHMRDYVKRISLVTVVNVELKQPSLPYGNTGVTFRELEE